MRAALRELLEDEASITAPVFVTKASQGQALPYVLITQISTDEHGALDGSGDFRSIVFDIDCKAGSGPDADTLTTAVRTFLKDYSGATGATGISQTIDAVLLTSEQTGYEAPTDGSDDGIFVGTLDVTIQYRPN